MKRFVFKTVATAFVALITFAATAGAQVTTGSIGGTITDEGGKPMPDVQVRVTNTSTGYRSTGTSRGTANTAARSTGMLTALTRTGVGAAITTRIGITPASTWVSICATN